LTRGNVSEEPIAFRDEDARVRLASICDLTLSHDRPIETRTDDSVARVVRVGGVRRPTLLRRSRGYVPSSLPLTASPDGAPVAPLLACGAELKNTFCLARGGRAWVSHHIGDLENAETLGSFLDGVAHLEHLFAVVPETVVHDLHPGYLSTHYALEREGVEAVGVQHHHAHLAACLAEHGEWGTAVGAVFDGTGYGLDGTVWGGEILVGDRVDFARAGALRPVPLPGGEQAIRQPWRMACVWLAEARGEATDVPPALAEKVDPARWRQVARLAATGLASPPTSSMGRLFDAVAALCGVRAAINYEGQAAIELEALSDPSERGSYAIDVVAGPDGLELDPRQAILSVDAEVAGGTSRATVAARFHNGVAAATAAACLRVAGEHSVDRVVLSGGVFNNRRLLETTAASLAAEGVRVLVPERLPAGDGGISFGQAAVAAARSGVADPERP
jgi:hydrogenase maturation protein HypF